MAKSHAAGQKLASPFQQQHKVCIYIPKLCYIKHVHILYLVCIQKLWGSQHPGETMHASTLNSSFFKGHFPFSRVGLGFRGKALFQGPPGLGHLFQGVLSFRYCSTASAKDQKDVPWWFLPQALMGYPSKPHSKASWMTSGWSSNTACAPR